MKQPAAATLTRIKSGGERQEGMCRKDAKSFSV
jgi:hypothetical protein